MKIDRARALRRGGLALLLAASESQARSDCDAPRSVALDIVDGAAASGSEQLQQIQRLEQSVIAELGASQISVCAAPSGAPPLPRVQILPSNESCRNADLSACTVTVGQLRRCHELARQAPCSLANDPLSPVDLSPRDPEPIFAECLSLDGCYPFVPTTDYAVTPACTAVGLEGLQTIDGVYEVTPERSDEALCSATLPEVLEMGAPRFVLVSTEASGVPEVILQSCNELLDCQALARELQAAASPRSATPYNHLLGCSTPLDAEPFFLVAVPIAGASPCQATWLPQVSVAGDPSSLLVMLSNLSDPPQVSPGCGYIIPSSRREPEACVAFAEYSAVRVSAL